MISKTEITRSKVKKAKNQVFLWLLGILSLVYCLLKILPWNPKGYGFDLDQSWGSAGVLRLCGNHWQFHVTAQVI